MLLVENDRDVHGIGATRNVKHIRYTSPLIDDDEWSSLDFKKSNIFSIRTFTLSNYLEMENVNYRICQSKNCNCVSLLLLQVCWMTIFFWIN